MAWSTIHMTRIYPLPIIALLILSGCGVRPVRLEDYPRPPQFSNFLELEIGKPAPDFELQTIDGEIWRLSGQRGKIVVLQFASATSPAFVQSLDDFQREVLSAYLLHPGVLFVYVFGQEAHPELLSAEDRAKMRKAPDEYRLAAAAQYYYRLRFGNGSVSYDLSGMIPAAQNVVILVDDMDDSAGSSYGYGRGGTTNPAFLIGSDGMLASKALYTLYYLSQSGYQAGNLPLMIQTLLRANQEHGADGSVTTNRHE